MGQVFSRKKFSSYLGEERAILDINTSYVPNPSPTPTPTPSMTPTMTNTPTPSMTQTLTSTPTPTLTSTPTLTPTTTPTVFSYLFYSASSYTNVCTSGVPVTLYSESSTITNGVALYVVPIFDIPYQVPNFIGLQYNGEYGEYDTGFMIYGTCPTPTPTPTLTRTVTPTPTRTSTPTPTPSTSPWTPAQLTGIYDWWSADYGVNESGGVVDDWEGHFGTLMVPQNPLEKPTYSAADANWNSKPSITLNNNSTSNSAEGMLAQVSGLDIDKTIIIVAKLIGYSSNKDYMPLMSLGTSDPGPRLALFLRQDINQFDGFNNQPDSETVFGTVATGDYLFSMMRYEQGAGFYEYYSSNNSGIINEDFGIDTGQTADVSYTTDSLAIGTYLTSADFDKTAKMSVVEFIALDSYITPGEITLLSTYLNNKYGL